MWIPLVNELGGKHHGYLVPYEGADDVGYALFTFPSLAEYEQYRLAIKKHPACAAAFAYAADTRCFERSERTFLRPVFG
jgi:hypothetical protein